MFKPKSFSVLFVLNAVLLLQICHPMNAQQEAMLIHEHSLNYNRSAFKTVNQVNKPSCVLCALYHAICILTGRPHPNYHPDVICKKKDCHPNGMTVTEGVNELKNPIKVTRFYDVSKPIEQLKSTLKAEINKNRPVILVFRCNKEVREKLEGTFMIAPVGLIDVTQYHAVCVVGYREDKRTRSLPSDSYIEIVNSWEPTWAAKGYGKIMWKDLEVFVQEAYSIEIVK
jgi:Papain family cysteine protease